MILAFSTSAPVVSVAAIDPFEGVLWSRCAISPRAASGTCLSFLEQLRDEMGIDVSDVDLFAADIGPGSFTGVRVGVTLAKTFGFLYRKPVAGANSFDLISVSRTVVLPSKRGEFFVRASGELPLRTTFLPDGDFVGFGEGIVEPTFPDATGFQRLLDRLQPEEAMTFAPSYLIDPSISTPKIPFPTLRGSGG